MTTPDEPIPLVPQMPREMRVAVVSITETQARDPHLAGKCHVIDGDTIVIRGTHIRLAGIDAPELDHPFGKQARWTLINLCKGQVVTARLKPELSHDRVVAQCFLPDGRDLAAEMVRMGMAIDWPKYSGGRYRQLEPEGVRKKLWRAAIRQRGMSTLLDDLPPIAPRPAPETASPRGQAPFGPPPPRPLPMWPTKQVSVLRRAFRRRTLRRLGWLVIPVLLVLVGCSLSSNDRTPASRAVVRPPPAAVQNATVPDIFVVTAEVLNVRSRPSANSEIVTQLQRGAMVVPHRVSGQWHAILLQDGSTGWVYDRYLSPAER